MTRTFFTGDTHFGHANVIKYANRPFASVEEMDEAMVANWNAVVGDHEDVYHLGDFAFYKKVERVLAVLCRLRGRKHLIFGNHDKTHRRDERFLKLWETTRDFAEIKIADPTAHDGKSRRIVLCHYAMLVWNKSHYGTWQLHGHSHGTLQDDPRALRLDVGVDCWGMAPVSYEVLRERMSKKTWVPIDHHGEAR